MTRFFKIFSVLKRNADKILQFFQILYDFSIFYNSNFQFEYLQLIVFLL
jgi:hypothetical protein